MNLPAWADAFVRPAEQNSRVRGTTYTDCKTVLATGGWNDAVHPQVFHHLTVMIKAMPYDQRSHS